jgi:hypothetical protein
MVQRLTTARGWSWHRLWPGLLPFALPIIYFGIITQSSVFYLLPLDQAWPAVKPEDFKLDSFDRFAHDAGGRLLHGTVTALTLVVSLATIVLALSTLSRKCGLWMALVVPVVALFGVGIGNWIATQDPLLAKVVYTPLQVAENAGVIFRGTLEKLKRLHITSMSLSGIAYISLMAAASAIAMRARPEERTVECLRQRMVDLQLITLAAAALLVLTVIGQRILLAWPQGLLQPDIAKQFALLANGFTTHSGVSATVLIACIVLPSILSLKDDIKLAAAAATNDGRMRERDWLKKNQLEFAPASVVTTALATAAPMLTGPLVDIVAAALRS